jgi:hypothetical protein
MPGCDDEWAKARTLAASCRSEACYHGQEKQQPHRPFEQVCKAVAEPDMDDLQLGSQRGDRQKSGVHERAGYDDSAVGYKFSLSTVANLERRA